MAIEFYLNPNNIHLRKEAYKAQLLTRTTLNDMDLIEAMLSRGTGVTRTDMIANDELRNTVLLEQLLTGNPIQTKLFKIRLKIEGVFDGITDRFDPKRHQVRVVITPSSYLQKQVKGLYPKCKAIKKYNPILSAVYGLGQNAVLELVPGEYFILRGSNLYLDPADPEQGIYFMNAQKEMTRVEEYPEIKPSSVLFRVPVGLASGPCKLTFSGCTKRGSLHQPVSYNRELNLLA